MSENEKRKTKRRTSHDKLLKGCTRGNGWNILTPKELERVKLLYALKKEKDAHEQEDQKNEGF